MESRVEDRCRLAVEKKQPDWIPLGVRKKIAVWEFCTLRGRLISTSARLDVPECSKYGANEMGAMGQRSASHSRPQFLLPPFKFQSARLHGGLPEGNDLSGIF